MTPANEAKLRELQANGGIAYIENWLRNGDITCHVANEKGRPLCGSRFTVLDGPHATVDNRGCFRCWRMRPDAFPGEFESKKEESDAK